VTILLLLLAVSVTSASGHQQSPAASDSAAEHVSKGYEALKVDNYEAAARELQAALDLDPSLVMKARFPLGVALFEMHKTTDARREFEAVRRDAGEQPGVSYYLGRLDIEERKYEAAIRNLNNAAAKPPFPDTPYYLGFAYLQINDLANAENWMGEAARLNPRDPRVPYQLAVVYRKQGKSEEAKKAFALSSELRQRDNDERDLRTECGDKLDKGPREEAHAFCEQLYEADNADKLTALGTIYGQHGDPEAALRPLLRAAELQPRSPQTQYNLALTYFQLNRFEDARAPLTGALQRWPDLFQLNALYGAVLSKLGDKPGAYQALHHAQKLNPQDAATGDLLYKVTLALGQENWGTRKAAVALGYVEEAAKLRPLEPEPHRRMAEIYAGTGRPSLAAVEERRAERLAKIAGK